MERERCVGCHSAPGPVCADCKGLTVGEVVATRWRWPSYLALGVTAAVFAAALPILWEAPVLIGIRVLELLFPVLVLLLWALGRMSRPHRLTLVRDRLELTSVLGGTRKLPLAEVVSDKGRIVHLPTHTRIRVGAARYDGAERFHRALRARRAELGLKEAQPPFY